jgi:hypothetical protein
MKYQVTLLCLLSAAAVTAASQVQGASEQQPAVEQDPATPNQGDYLLQSNRTAAAFDTEDSRSGSAPAVHMQRIRQRARSVYGRVKSGVLISRGTYYLVDYALSLGCVAAMFGPPSSSAHQPVQQQQAAIDTTLQQ